MSTSVGWFRDDLRTVAIKPGRHRITREWFGSMGRPVQPNIVGSLSPMKVGLWDTGLSEGCSTAVFFEHVRCVPHCLTEVHLAALLASDIPAGWKSQPIMAYTRRRGPKNLGECFPMLREDEGSPWNVAWWTLSTRRLLLRGDVPLVLVEVL